MAQEIQTFVNSIGAVEIDSELRKFFIRENYFTFPETENLLIIKISRIAKPFFGVDKRVIEYADKNIEVFYLILLSSEKTGWVYSKEDIKKALKNNRWSYSSNDYNYKIGTNAIDDRYWFNSIPEFYQRLKEKEGK